MKGLRIDLLLKSMASKLPPLDFTEEIEEFEAKHESKEIRFPSCPHKEVSIENGSLKCKCGNAWYGSATQLTKLKELLTA